MLALEDKKKEAEIGNNGAQHVPLVGDKLELDAKSLVYLATN
jgi:hypothetical protein